MYICYIHISVYIQAVKAWYVRVDLRLYIGTSHLFSEGKDSPYGPCAHNKSLSLLLSSPENDCCHCQPLPAPYKQ